MPTPLDRALQSKAAFVGFAGIITATAAWAIWGSDVFPAQPDPTGDPEGWSHEELCRWLNRRELPASPATTREELLKRVKIYQKTAPGS